MEQDTARYSRLGLLALVAALVVPGISAADLMSDAAKIGANAGAMKYCEENVASPDDQNKYRLLKVSAYREYDDLDDSDKVKALVARKAAEDGDYLGDPLDEERCDRLRKMLFLKYRD